MAPVQRPTASFTTSTTPSLTWMPTITWKPFKLSSRSSNWYMAPGMCAIPKGCPSACNRKTSARLHCSPLKASWTISPARGRPALRTSCAAALWTKNAATLKCKVLATTAFSAAAAGARRCTRKCGSSSCTTTAPPNPQLRKRLWPPWRQPQWQKWCLRLLWCQRCPRYPKCLLRPKQKQSQK